MTEEQVLELKKYAFCSGCGHRLNEPLGLNSLGNPFNSCCPDNNYVVNLSLVKSLFAAHALPQPDPENYTIRDAHDQLDFDGASYQDAIQSPQPTGEEAVVFAEWLEENRVGIDFREERTHTIGELYEIFKKNHQ
jgi:hypothetical protein